MKRLTPARARRLATTLVGLWTKKLDPASMRASAIVFSPHQDDETLGCGGTILKKRELGASVQMVFMTDGTKSPPTTAAQELKSLREQEALAACRQLLIEKENVTFLEFEDGELSEQIDQAVERVGRFLAGHPAEQVYVPYYQDRDPGLDHVATNRIVRSALQGIESRPVVFEYPIWFWRFWPQARMPVRGQPGAWNTLPHSLLPNLRALGDFRSCVEIDDVLDRKRAALNQHGSQLEQLNRIQSGGFAQWFFGKREIFYRHTLP